MKSGFAITGLSRLLGATRFRGTCAFVLVICFGQGAVSGQPAQKNGAKVPIEDATRATNQQEIIARLFGVVNELKSESDRSAAALLHSEIADVLWRFDEPAARTIFRLAFDTVRQVSPNNSSSIDPDAKRQSMTQSRRRTSAIKTVLKRYGLHDQKGAEAWLKEFEDEIKAERKASENGKMSQEQAELLGEMALGLVSRDPKEAQRLGSLLLSAEKIPSPFGRLLMALRGRDKALGDVLFRQAFLSMRSNDFKYDSALVSLANYEFFADGRPFPDVSPADVGLIIQYLVDAASAQAARWRSGSVRDGDEQASMGNLYSFLFSRALSIVALNSPDKLVLLQSNVGELAQGLTGDQRQQAEMLASLTQQRSNQVDGSDSDIESRIHQAEQEKNSSTRNMLLRNLVLNLMRSDPEQALEVAGKIDDVEVRGQTEDDVYLVLMQKAFRGGSYEEARKLALKMNDHDSRARWLAEIASQVSSRSKDRTEATNLLSEAYSMAAKSDNTPAKLHALLLIANEFVRFDQERGFNILSDAVDTTNRLDAKVQSKPNYPPGPFIKVISITVVGGKEVSTADRPTVSSIDFNQISAFAERDYVRTSALGVAIKDHLFRAKYFIALARSVLHVPRQGSGYERTLEDIISN
jgi:hypothetical protein